MTATAKVIGSRVDLGGRFGGGSLPLDEATRELWADWSQRYHKASRVSTDDLLRPIGREMFDWLNSGGLATKWLAVGGPRQLELAADAEMTPDQRLLLALPWELLGTGDGYLAQDSVQPFEVWRRIGLAGTPTVPAYRDLSLLFMACSPRSGGHELEFEREEAAILSATENLKLALSVEESGCVDFLSARIRREGSFDAYHFSCHGDLFDSETAQRFAEENAEEGPNLVMESHDGDRDFVSPNRLAEVWENNPPPLVFVSACRTSEASQDLAESYTSRLARGVPAVIGWDGSVNDPDAIDFSEAFYSELASYRTTPQAAAFARRKLLANMKPGNRTGSHWHLARLWLGTNGGGALCLGEGARRRLPTNAGYSAYLDLQRERVKIAGPLTFVGRRRFAQDAVKALRQNDAVGLLLFGMGNLGKSSLAARIANRLPELKSVVIYGDYDASAVLKTVIEALPPRDQEQALSLWEKSVRDNPSSLELALRDLLSDSFFDSPILLIVDDLEKILEDPAPGADVTRVRLDHGWSETIAAILSAFKKDREDSRLMFTSRFDFSAADANGRDLAVDLQKIQLTQFSQLEREKQLRAKLLVKLRSPDAIERMAAEDAVSDTRYSDLALSCLLIAEGNPGLQDILTRPLLSGEFDAVAGAIDAIRQNRDDLSKIPNEENAAFEFFTRMAFQRYKDALTSTESLFLHSASIFGDRVWPPEIEASALAELHAYQADPVPVPQEALDAVGESAGVSDTTSAKQRLIGLGLLDVYATSRTGANETGYLVNQFARPLVSPLSIEERSTFAGAALEPLEKNWAGGTDKWPTDARSVEALRLAFHAGTVR